MSIELKSHHYNYYNVKGRYSPAAPEQTGWEKLYEQTTDQVKSNNYNPDSEKYKAYVKLEDIYYDKGVANRAKYSSYSELQQALGQKYLFGDAYKGYSYTERKAMYENELNMTAFGHCSNFQDPRLGGPVHADTDKEVQAYNRQSVNNQINNIFLKGDIDLSALAGYNLKFAIEPHDFRLTILGLDDNEDMKEKMEELLNANNNSKELFFHIMKSMTNNGVKISDNVMAKYRVLRELKTIAGTDLNDFTQTKSGLVNSAGKNVLDVYKGALKKSSSVPSEFKNTAYSLFQDNVSKITEKDINTIPDLNLSVGYQNGTLIDDNNSGVINRTLNMKV